MNQCAHRSRTFHGIGQPDVKREHGALAGSADEHQSQRQRNHGSAASKKAFIVTRFADLGFLIGILVYGYYAGTYTFQPNEMALLKGGAAI